MTRTAPAPSRPTILAERCAHQQVATARCDACVQACPRQAWQMRLDGLAFDPSACDGCGLCVTACPHEALELPAPTPILPPDGARELWIACERTGLPMADASPALAGFTACLHALTPDWILQWHRRHRITQVHLATGNCAACTRRPTATLQSRWQPVAERLAAAGHPAPRLSPVDARQWLARTSRTQAPDPRRRRFLGQLLQGPRPEARGGTPVSSLAPLTSGRRQLVHTLATPGPAGKTAEPLWQVQLDPGTCAWCRACVNLCPEQVFMQAFRADGTVQSLRLNQARCTGCALCLDACDAQALTVTGPEAAHRRAQATFDLTRETCPVCDVAYLRYQAAVPPHVDTGQAGPCPTCRSGRAVRPNRLVQPAEPVGSQQP